MSNNQRLSNEELAQIKERAEKGEKVVFPEEYPGYAITSYGRVFSYGHDWRGYGVRELKQIESSKGYLRVRMTIDGKRKSYMVHKLVAEFFLDDKPDYADQIRHLDGDKTNNRKENLAWGDAKENAADRKKHGRDQIGSKNKSSKLTEKDVEEIKELLKTGEFNNQEIGDMYRVSKNTIRYIAIGRHWNHVGGI